MSVGDASDPLVADALQAALGKSIIGREIVVLEETTSTNDAVLRLATSGAGEGFVVFAEHQTAGRGQRGNRWESAPRKGLWFSILLRPKIELAESVRLVAWATETIADTIQSEFSLAAIIKAPNDVHVSEKKIAGVLVEMRAQEKAAHLAIAGIGINLNQSAQDFPQDLRARATSVAMALDQAVDRQKFAIALLRNLDRSYRELLAP